MARIIVVDDEPNHLDMVATILERAGHEVMALPGAKACLQALQDKGADIADIIVTDIFMSGLDGIQLLVAIQTIDDKIPVIGMSGGTIGKSQEVMELMQEMGAVKVLKKPFTQEDLLNAVGLCLPNKYSQ